ncbi:hypothetical protein RSOL_448450 [Rhizoctonia solani AG-3 Rhs1AP]|uniref:Uncharacterized protein n=2 Tax=Rhizoctonia solani AG-3 TaxID=1086053 RepID=A0A074RZU0_9AGAM|nr:hypothetical protein RSOL_448450 [Rhizoctonia solani AG-3 Rhs1AP]KEP50800.1 hypothetical protein V565_073200 [Rhizoctonia solani 123E]
MGIKTRYRVDDEHLLHFTCYTFTWVVHRPPLLLHLVQSRQTSGQPNLRYLIASSLRQGSCPMTQQGTLSDVDAEEVARPPEPYQTCLFGSFHVLPWEEPAVGGHRLESWDWWVFHIGAWALQTQERDSSDALRTLVAPTTVAQRARQLLPWPFQHI